MHKWTLDRIKRLMLDVLSLFKAHGIIFAGCGINLIVGVQRNKIKIRLLNLLMHTIGCIVVGMGGFFIASAYMELNGIEKHMPYLLLSSQLIFSSIGPNGLIWLAEQAFISFGKGK